MNWPRGTMSALTIEGPGRLGRSIIDIPESGEGSVLVWPRYVGLCGTDLELLHGKASYFRDGRARYPHVFGHEWWGEVVTDAAGFAAGDPVVGHTMLPCGRCANCARGRRQICHRLAEVGLYGHQGAAAEFIRMPAHALTRLPPELAVPWAVLVEPAVTVVEALERTGCGPLDRVAVLGSGTIGLLAVQLARHRGAAVDVIGIDPAGLDLAARNGATVFSPGTAPMGEYSLVVEASGAAEAFVSAFDLVEPGGRVAVVGVANEPVAGLVPATFVLRGVSAIGIQHGLDHYDAAVRLFADGVVDGAGLVADVIPESEAEQAFKLLQDGRTGRPKVILELGGGR